LPSSRTPFLALVALAFVVASCGGGHERVGASAGPRVVSLHEVTTEMVVALGADARLVGIGDPVDPSPELARALASVPRVDGLESILALHPTTVLGLQTVGEQSPELVAELRARKIDVWLGDPATLADVHAMVQEVAKRSGVADGGQALLAKLDAREAAVAQAAASPSPTARRLRVFVYDCCDPPFTAGGKTVLTDLIRRAGGDNVFADIADDWTHVSWEAAAERAPDLAIVNAYAMEGQGDVDAKVASLRRIPTWKDLPIVVVPLGEALGGLRSLDGLERLGREFQKIARLRAERSR
jgi:iron complex transport system substrate-binding protein